MSVPFKIVDVESELNKKLLTDFHGERNKFLQVGPKKYFFPSKYEKQAADYYNFKVRSDDVWICTYPRSGTTLMQEMLWLIVNDLDYETAAAKPLMVRFPFIEFSIVVDDGLKEDILEMVRGNPAQEAFTHEFTANKVPLLNETPSPRLIKSHLPFSLLPPNLLNTCKVVYVARNPKDMVVSFYHHNRLLTTQGYVGDFPKYYEYFEQGLLPWSPYWEHISEAWEMKENPNLLFLFYENIVKDMDSSIKKVAEFFGKTMTDEQVTRLANHLHIDNFRKNPSTNLDAEILPGLRVQGEQNFIRQGKNGSWKAEFTPELSAKADKWIAENIIKLPGFAFPEL